VIPQHDVTKITGLVTLCASSYTRVCISKCRGYISTIPASRDAVDSTEEYKKNVDPLLHPVYIQECHP